MSKKISTQKRLKNKKTGKIRKNKTLRKKKTFRKKNYSVLKKKVGKVFQRGGDTYFTVKDDIKSVNRQNIVPIEPGKYEVELPDSVEKIADNTFKYIELIKLDLGKGVKEIGENAFANNLLKELILPNSLVKIGDGAFADNHYLKSITMPSRFNNDKDIIRIFGFEVEDGSYYNIPPNYYYNIENNIYIEPLEPVKFTFTDNNEEYDDDEPPPPSFNESRQQIINTSN